MQCRQAKLILFECARRNKSYCLAEIYAEKYFTVSTFVNMYQTKKHSKDYHSKIPTQKHERENPLAILQMCFSFLELQHDFQLLPKNRKARHEIVLGIFDIYIYIL